MPKSPKFIRRRITSVRKTQQITKAMKMVAAAKLRRAQDRILKYKPYADDLETILFRLVVAMRKMQSQAPQGRPITLPPWCSTEPIDGGPRLVVTVASERGLCGSFNTHLMRSVEKWAQGVSAGSVRFLTVGRKAREYLTRRKYDVFKALTASTPEYETWVPQIRESAMEAFQKEGAQVFLAYNHLRTLTSQKPVVRRLLPVEVPEDFAVDQSLSWIFEPDLQGLADRIIDLYLESQIRKTLYESEAGEHSARMAAMENATKNAREMIDRLTLEMNKARQAGITKDLMDIVNGAEALRG